MADHHLAVKNLFPFLQNNQSPSLKPRALEVQIDYSDSLVALYEENPDHDIRISSDYWTDQAKTRSEWLGSRMSKF